MKILVINGSPRGKASNTDVLTQAFLAGAHEAGAESEVVYLAGKKINHCCGNFICWIKTPGTCVHKDDMPELLEKMKSADMVVYATPLYVYNVTGMMKIFMDRIIPIVQPYIVERNGVCSHPRRDGRKLGKAVVISNAGFIDQAHFDGLKATFRCMYRDDTLAGMICCGGGEMLRQPELREAVQWYIDATHNAGREAVTDGKISEETQKLLDKPLMEDRELFMQMANMHWDAELEKLETEKPEMNASLNASDITDAVPLVPGQEIDTVRDLLAAMPLAFNAKEAGSLTADIQFVLTDEQPDHYYLSISGGECKAYLGKSPKPAITITTPGTVWMAIARHEMNGAAGLITGKYKVSGDMTLLMRFDKLFVSA
ncbi:MAG: NAD(P)H-dependent oxidoreductase [bacterium]